MTSEQIQSLIGAIEDPHHLCLMCIGLFCATRTSETFGLQWKSYLGDRLIIHSTAYEGELYRGRVKTGASRSAVPIPDDIIPIVEAWRRESPDSSPEGLPDVRQGRTQGPQGASTGQELPQMANLPQRRQAEDPEKAGYISGDAAKPRTDLQKHVTMKDAQVALRHASIKTTADVYKQVIPGERPGCY